MLTILKGIVKRLGDGVYDPDVLVTHDGRISIRAAVILQCAGSPQRNEEAIFALLVQRGVIGIGRADPGTAAAAIAAITAILKPMEDQRVRTKHSPRAVRARPGRRPVP